MKSNYQRPRIIPNNMGGSNDLLDERLANVMELLRQAPLDSMKSFLDIGMGQGQILKWLSKQGKICTGTGLEMSSYEVDVEKLKKDFGIIAVECDAEHLPFPNQSFDGVIMSHVLEHCLNVGLVLAEARRVLTDNGWLMLFVPPYDERVCAGHVTNGWNIGQLMYILLLMGFDVRRGRFIKYGYNVCAFVPISAHELPPLRGDQGDIHILQEAGLFPAPVETEDGLSDGYWGELIACNWSEEFVQAILKNKYRQLPYKYKFVHRVVSRMPAALRRKLARGLVRIGKQIQEFETEERVNPKILKG